MNQTVEHLRELFERSFGSTEGRKQLLVVSPGRTELAGNHTDHNNGRVLAAAGYSGAAVDDRRAEVFYGRTWAYRRGKVADAAQLAKLAKELEGKELEVTVDLHLGGFASTIYTCDLSLDYVHINADYTT